MNGLLAGAAVATALTGVLALVVAFLPAPPSSSRPGNSLWNRTRATVGRMSRMSRVLLLVGLLLGIVAAAASGSLLAIAIVPCALLFGRFLLSAPTAATDIALLEAVESWARNVSGLTSAGQDLESAIRLSLPSTPERIQAPVRMLVARLNSQWNTADALDRFADELHDATADVLVANLKLTAKFRTGALGDALQALADTINDEVAARREVEAQRATPRLVSRSIFVVATIVIIGMFFNGTYMAPYNTPFGQILLALLIAVFAGSLLWMRQVVTGKTPARILLPGKGE
ncbi:type II secretion system F family protein [Paenarthrobacter nicotinovorans]|uniref:type II secretion system F family protein n=1 Tax=Paenarthrobacter nicotinovorans TaxID=29320 RepID=UPI0011A7A79C|nr:type II secretion system F family protein [Paenarthrobacter nicotinovorans]